MVDIIIMVEHIIVVVLFLHFMGKHWEWVDGKPNFNDKFENLLMVHKLMEVVLLAVKDSKLIKEQISKVMLIHMDSMT